MFNIVDEADSLKKDGYSVSIKEGEQITTPSGFLVRRYTYHVGIRCGMITESFIESERNRLGVLFGMYYEADFYTSDQTLFKKEFMENTSTTSNDLYGAFEN